MVPLLSLAKRLERVGIRMRTPRVLLRLSIVFDVGWVSLRPGEDVTKLRRFLVDRQHAVSDAWILQPVRQGDVC